MQPLCHCTCSGITNEAYSYYEQTSHFTWNCPRCIAGCLLFHDCSFLTSEGSLVTHFNDNYVSNFVQIHHGLLVLMVSSFLMYLQLSILVFILVRICHGTSIHKMLFKEFTLGYIVLTVYIPCLLSLLNYIVFLCYPFWITVMWYGHHHLCSTLNTWRGFIQGSIVHLYSTDFSACMTLAERRQYHAAIQVYRVLHKLSPSYLNAKFHHAVDITSRTGQNLYHLFQECELL